MGIKKITFEKNIYETMYTLSIHKFGVWKIICIVEKYV